MIEISVFKEPRGVIRILQLIFSICAFATTTNFGQTLELENCDNNGTLKRLIPIEYPFQLKISEKIYTDFSSDSRFFVATGVLSLLYCLFILVGYVFLDDVYRNNTKVPLIDFISSVILTIFWLSGSAAWANGVTGLKNVTDAKNISEVTHCTVANTIRFANLNISLIFGFLNFFIWGSGLWFIYKETTWFQQRQNGPITPNV